MLVYLIIGAVLAFVLGFSLGAHDVANTFGYDKKTCKNLASFFHRLFTLQNVGRLKSCYDSSSVCTRDGFRDCGRNSNRLQCMLAL